MNILNWIQTMMIEYCLDVAFIVAMIAVLCLAYKRGKKDFVSKVVLALVVKAEKQLGDKSGDFKYAAVVSWVYPQLPWFLKFLFKPKDIDYMIEAAVSQLKSYLDGGGDLLGHSEESKNITAIVNAASIIQ